MIIAYNNFNIDYFINDYIPTDNRFKARAIYEYQTGYLIKKSSGIIKFEKTLKGLQSEDQFQPVKATVKFKVTAFDKRLTQVKILIMVNAFDTGKNKFIPERLKVIRDKKFNIGLYSSEYSVNEDREWKTNG